jgi:hypothetical protein
MTRKGGWVPSVNERPLSVLTSWPSRPHILASAAPHVASRSSGDRHVPAKGGDRVLLVRPAEAAPLPSRPVGLTRQRATGDINLLDHDYWTAATYSSTRSFASRACRAPTGVATTFPFRAG